MINSQVKGYLSDPRGLSNIISNSSDIFRVIPLEAGHRYSGLNCLRIDLNYFS